ncbi:SA1362 family protein [Pseudalkalibacillus caeni]|uniref:Uncharacterized protein n=1 Tax=Exobacillus caeni TaxID=2574798 RepID=A0A5R9F411_9BACL|nr:SA1362 family protein [Pseudalkalibacillus caeni]TLS36358.1 hypothetical protein FCL54_15625 [Pseudalkalibacillus caeni]
MANRFVQPLIYFIMVLALIGFGWRLITEPMSLLTQILIAVAIAGIFYFIYKRFIAKQSSPENSAYKRAAKQSLKMKKRRESTRKQASHLRLLKSKPLLKNKKNRSNIDKKEIPFTVIEGRKGKKKNRALF